MNMNGSVIVSTKSCSNGVATGGAGGGGGGGGGASMDAAMMTNGSRNGPTNSNSSSNGGGGPLAVASSNSRRSPTPPSNNNQAYDITMMREDDYEKNAVYMVKDVATERGTPNRAKKTLPRSLTLKPSLVLSTPDALVSSAERHFVSEKVNQLFHFLLLTILLQTYGVWSTGVIPRGTRFGPFQGVPTPHYPLDKNAWKYFWRVSRTTRFYLSHKPIYLSVYLL